MNWNYLFTSTTGRINRKPYWIGAIVLGLAGFFLQYVVFQFFGALAALAVGLVLLYPSFALMLKRAHDRNRPTWLVALFYAFMAFATLTQPTDVENMDMGGATVFLLFAVPWMAMSVFFLIDLGFLRGTAGPNRYGTDPLA